MAHTLFSKIREALKQTSIVPVVIAISIYIANRTYFRSEVISVLAISLVCVWYWLRFKRSRYLNAVAAVVLTATIAPAISEDLYHLNIQKTLELISVISTASIVTIISRAITGSQLTTEANGEQNDFNHKRRLISISDIVFSLLLLPVPIYWWGRSYDHDISESLIVVIACSLTAIGIWRSFRIKHPVSKYLRMFIIVASCLCSIYLLTPIRIDPHRSLFYFYSSYYGIGVKETLICIAITMIFVCSGEYSGLRTISIRPPATIGRFLSKLVQYGLLIFYFGFLLSNLVTPHGYDPDNFYRSEYFEVGWPEVFQITEKTSEKRDFVFGELHDVYGVEFFKSAFIYDAALVVILTVLFGFGISIISNLHRSNWRSKLALWNCIRILSILGSLIGLALVARNAFDRSVQSSGDSFSLFSRSVSAPLIEQIFHGEQREQVYGIGGLASELVTASSRFKRIELIQIDKVDSKTVDLLATYPKLTSLRITNEPIDGNVFSELMYLLKLNTIHAVVAKDATLTCNSKYLKELSLTSEIDESKITVREAEKLSAIDANLFSQESGSLVIENCEKVESIQIKTFCNATKLTIRDCQALNQLNVVGDEESTANIQTFDAEIINSKIGALFCGNLSPRQISSPDGQNLILFLRYDREMSETLYSDLNCNNVTTIFYIGCKAGAFELLKNVSQIPKIIEIGLMVDDIEYETFWDGFDQFNTPCTVKVSPPTLELDEQQLEQLKTIAPPKFEVLDSF